MVSSAIMTSARTDSNDDTAAAAFEVRAPVGPEEGLWDTSGVSEASAVRVGAGGHVDKGGRQQEWRKEVLKTGWGGKGSRAIGTFGKRGARPVQTYYLGNMQSRSRTGRV